MSQYLRGTKKDREEQMKAFRDGKAGMMEFTVLKAIAGKAVGETIELMASKDSGVPLDRHWFKYHHLGYFEVKKDSQKTSTKSKKTSKSETKSEE